MFLDFNASYIFCFLLHSSYRKNILVHSSQLLTIRTAANIKPVRLLLDQQFPRYSSNFCHITSAVYFDAVLGQKYSGRIQLHKSLTLNSMIKKKKSIRVIDRLENRKSFAHSGKSKKRNNWALKNNPRNMVINLVSYQGERKIQ